MTKKGKVTAVILMTDIVLGIAFFAAVRYYLAAAKEVSLQNAAELWAADGGIPYSAVSVHRSEKTAFTLGDILSAERKITAKIKEQLTDEDGDSAVYCFSAHMRSMVSGSKDSSEMLIYATGGDYFSVHLPELLSGGLYDGSSMNIDIAVLDDLASWKLFGSADTAGMKIEIYGREFTVSGVIKSPRTKYVKNAYDDANIPGVVYIPYQAAEDLRFTEFNAMLPDPIENFAENTVREELGVKEDTRDAAVTDSRSEFTVKTINKNYKEARKLLSSDSEVEYTYFADAGRAAHMDIYTLYNVFSKVFALLMISACYYIVTLCGLIAAAARRIYKYFDDEADRKKLIKYYETHPKVILKPEENEEGEGQ